MPFLNMSPLGAAPDGGGSPSYANYGGEGLRWGEIEITNTATLGGGTDIQRLIDGRTDANSSGACWFNGGQSTRALTFDWRANAVILIDKFKWKQDNNDGHGTWVLEGSNDLSGWTQIGSSFTLGGSSTETEYDFTGNVTSYRAHRLRQTSGTTSSGPWLQEIKFSLLDTSGGSHTSYGHTDGSGDRTASITVTTDLALDSGNINNLVDGAFGSNGTDAIDISDSQSGKYIRFDFGVGRVVDGFRWYASATANMGTWEFQGSNDASGWTTIGSSFTLGNGASPAFTVFTSTNTTSYRYYQLKSTAGSTPVAGPWCQEIEFRIR